jgi:hypothetical protein
LRPKAFFRIDFGDGAPSRTKRELGWKIGGTMWWRLWIAFGVVW